jgi:uncharacterized membrane protein (DUF4010 family)
MIDHTLFEGAGLEPLASFLTSLGIGLLIGLERERSPAAKAGLRTFALVAMLGTLAAFVSERAASPWLLAAGLLAVGAMIIAAYLQGTPDDGDPGTTTVAALLMCYGLGALVWYGFSTIAVMLAIVTTILLYFKTELHGVTRSLTRRDLVSMLQFAVLSFIILPILPDRNFGPYDAFNPHQLWLMVVLISGVSLAGYLALRIVGERYGTPLLGLFGGLVSSTATTLVYARNGRAHAEMAQLAVVVILLANLVLPVRVGMLTAVVSLAVLPKLLPVLAGGLVLGLAATLYRWQALGDGDKPPVPEIANPTELGTALSFGAIYGVVLLLGAWLSDVAGPRGLYAVALVSGLTDVDAITLSTLRLFELGKLGAEQAVTTIGLAMLANIVFKTALVFVIGGTLLGRRAAPGLLLTAAGIGTALLLR